MRSSGVDAGQVVPVEQRTLHKRLEEAGCIGTGEDGRRTVNVRVGERTQRVLKLSRAALPKVADDREQREQDAPPNEAAPEPVPLCPLLTQGRGSWRATSHRVFRVAPGARCSTLSAAELFRDLRARGVAFAAADGRLRVEAPVGLLSDGERERLRDERDDVLTLLGLAERALALVERHGRQTVDDVAAALSSRSPSPWPRSATWPRRARSSGARSGRRHGVVAGAVGRAGGVGAGMSDRVGGRVGALPSPDGELRGLAGTPSGRRLRGPRRRARRARRDRRHVSASPGGTPTRRAAGRVSTRCGGLAMAFALPPALLVGRTGLRHRVAAPSSGRSG